jgi:hypothetical protein
MKREEVLSERGITISVDSEMALIHHLHNAFRPAFLPSLLFFESMSLHRKLVQTHLQSSTNMARSASMRHLISLPSPSNPTEHKLTILMYKANHHWVCLCGHPGSVPAITSVE